MKLTIEIHPAIPRPEHAKQTADNLRKLETRFGRKSNKLTFVVDDMGWCNPGEYSGG